MDRRKRDLKMNRVYLTIIGKDRHIQYADINEDNYVCNVETSDEDAQYNKMYMFIFSNMVYLN